MSNGKIIARLFLISLLSLFCEMMVIRWLATEVRVFAYFKNLPLIASFLGLGLGFLIAHNKKLDFMKWSSICLLYFSGLMITAIGTKLTHLTFVDPSKIMLFGDYGLGSLGLAQSLTNIAIVIGIFVLTTTIFVGLGQKTGELFDKLKPLQAYSINVAGGLAGIVLFALLSQFETGPGVWLIVAGAMYLLWETTWKQRIAPALLVVLGVAYMSYLAPLMGHQLFGNEYVTTVWSPYYRIDVRKAMLPVNGKNIQVGHEIYINYDSFQSMLDCTPETLAQLPEKPRKDMLEFFERPLRVTRKEHPNVLILGSGSGSDVAAALRCGASHVDAVEIDRSIYELGEKMHPEHPYDSPKVTAHIMDARTFLKNTKEKYDVVLYALLDSHTAFSSLSSLRTDNYVFTEESFEEAAKTLTKDGCISVSFIAFPDWLWDRHAKDLYTATKQMPVGYFWTTSLPNGLLVTGPGIKEFKPTFALPERKLNIENPVAPITDDWPFLFLPKMEIPVIYVLPVVIVLLLSLFPVARLVASGRKAVLNWQMLFLGMGFMLLEVRAMSSMSLLCGATWTVNSIVIGGVMVAILLANIIANKTKEHAVPKLVFFCAVAIVLSTLVDISDLSSLPPIMAVTAGTVVFISPLFFAAIIFGSLFKRSEHSSHALAFNMIGGVIGVTMEYLSMAFGVKMLSAFALGIYVVVLLLEHVRERAEGHNSRSIGNGNNVAIGN